MKTRNTFIGGGIALVLATACCWLPFVALLLGGATTVAALSDSLENYSGVFMAVGVGFLGLGLFQVYKKQKAKTNNKEINFVSVLTCPECGFHKEERMSSSSCQYFYECINCKTILKPRSGDCCVFCSYGTVVCPPIQSRLSCC